MSKFSERLNQMIAERGIRKIELADKAGISRGLITHYTQDARTPRAENAERIASILNVSKSWLLGYTDDMDEGYFMDANTKPRLIPKRLQMLGAISCGVPKFADPSYDVFVSSVGMNADYCLIADGTSMIGARINDGDIIFVKQTNTVDNGDIAVVGIGDELLLKRVFIYDDRIVLHPENENYEDVVFRGSDMLKVNILGKAVGFQSII